MQISIWPQGSNPLVDPRILKKSMSHCVEQVRLKWYRWIDPADPKKGCIATRAYRETDAPSREHKIAAGTMMGAWGVIQSGYGGPNVWQMHRDRA